MTLPRRLAFGFVFLLTLAAAHIATPAAQAAALTAELTLDDLVQSDTGITLQLTVANTGEEPLFGGQVMVWHNQAAATAAELAAALANPDEGGLRLGDPLRETYHVLGDQATAFDPGATASFTLQATWSQLDLEEDGVYLVGAQLWASADERSVGEVVASVYTIIVRAGATAAERTNIVALTSAPSQLAGDLFADDHLADEFRGRLTDLARAANRPGTGWLLDPALYAAAKAMADGYEVVSAAGTNSGTGAAAAANWLALVDALPRAAGFRSLWGDPDLALGAALNDPSLISRCEAALAAADPATAGLAGLPLAVWLPRGGADDAYLAYVAAASPAIVLAPPSGSEPAAHDGGSGDLSHRPATEAAAASPEASPVLDTPADTGGGGADNTGSDRLVPTVSPAFPGVPAPGTVDAGFQKAQRAAAEDYLSAVAGRVSVRVLASVEELADAAAPLPGWVSLRPAQTLTAATVDAAAGAAANPSKPVLGAAQRDAVVEAASRFAAYAELVSDPAASAFAAGGLAAALSQDWADPAAALPYIASLRAQADDRLGQVRLLVTDHLTLTSHDAIVPITVANDLDLPVTVRLQFTSSSPLRLTASYNSVITVLPHDRLGLTLEPKVSANGDARLSTAVTTEKGQPLGPPAVTEVSITESGRLAWLVVAVSGLTLVVGTVRHVRRTRQNQRAESAREDSPAPADRPSRGDDGDA
ncbi:MAG: DUF6049 family protein [Propionibacteriaceae bacterium]|nr:DUF6049 family protein [Propionibacteriaceae bacterium]